jgi:hypothetical protein
MAADLLAKLRTAGLTILLDGEQLIVSPRDRLTNELRAAIRKSKPELIGALTDERQHPPFPDLLERVRQMAKRWEYSPDELAEELKRAAVDPVRALSFVEHDETVFGCGDIPHARN